DHALKLQVANATHTAMVHFMALSRMRDTAACIIHTFIMTYLNSLIDQDIAPLAAKVRLRELGIDEDEVYSVWRDWSKRLTHPHFGLSTLFVSQNAFQKLGTRLLPSVRAALRERQTPSTLMAFATAALLRFITPSER
ncbi:unnamed protein product, partial [Discosporangium mesarthrocarpum]